MTAVRFPLIVAALTLAAALWPAPASAQGASAPAPETGYQDGFFIQTANGDYRLVLGGLAQFDGRFAINDANPVDNTFTLRKMRPILSGRIARFFDFKLMPDFGGGTPVVADAYFDIRFSSKLRIRTGKDKTPVGYEFLIGDAYVLFVDRAVATNLVPGRDLGVAVQGDLSPKVSYAIGVFNGVPDGTSSVTELDTNSGKDLAGRMVVQPFRSPATPARALNGLGFQIGASTGKEVGALPSFRTSTGQVYFSYAAGAAADGRRTRFTPAIFYYYKAFGAFGEYAQSRQEVTRGGVLTHVLNRGWEVSGSIVLTGETGADRGVRPRVSFDPQAGHFGALQLVARYARIDIDDHAFPSGLAAAGATGGTTQLTFGANWYPNPQLKYYASFDHFSFENDPGATRPAENVVLVRAQLAF